MIPERDRAIHHDRGWGVPTVKRRGINQRLEGRPGLTFGLRHAIELTASEVIAANHRLDLARSDINSNQGSLGSGSILLPTVLALHKTSIPSRKAFSAARCNARFTVV